eukprot:gene542-1040_t
MRAQSGLNYKSGVSNLVSGIEAPSQYLSKPPKFLKSDVGYLDRSKQLQAKAVKLTNSGEASISSSVFNLVKNIVGSGAFSLPSAVAFFSDDKKALIPSSIICIIVGLLSAYTFSVIGQACQLHNVESYQDAWAKSVDPNSAWLISGGITCMCFLGSVMFSIVIGDSFASLSKSYNLPSFLQQRSNILLLITISVLIPLFSLENLNSLAPFSILGLAGTVFTTIFMAIRLKDQSYTAINGQFFDKPAIFGTKYMEANIHIFVLLSMLSTSFICHYNAPRFLTELKQPTLQRYNIVVYSAFIISIISYILIKSIGFLTFGANCQGFVLNNYSGSDNLAKIARVAISAAIISGYPFTFCALRDGFMNLCKIPNEKRSSLIPILTISLVSLITFFALILKDVGFIVSLSGASVGSALMFIAPAVMNICNINTVAKRQGLSLSRSKKVEIVLNYSINGMGIVLAVVGVYVSVMKQFGKL